MRVIGPPCSRATIYAARDAHLPATACSSGDRQTDRETDGHVTVLIRLLRIICQQSYLLTIIWYSIGHLLFHSRLKTFLFCKSFPLQPFFFFFGTDFTDSPDCLLLFLSISVYYS